MNPRGEHIGEDAPHGDIPPKSARQKERETGSKSGQSKGGSEEGEGRGNPVSRLAGESRALFDDLREWVDLRVQLVQVDIEERIEKAANEVIAVIMVVVLGLFALAFLLHGLAIWIGTALGGTHWGYLIVAGILALTTIALRSVKPDFMSRRQQSPSPKEGVLPASRSPKAILPENTHTDTDIAEDKKEGEEHA
jgi:hypothetical protein